GASPALSAVWSADGKWLAAGTRDGEVIVIDAVAMRVVRRRHGHQRPVQNLAFNPAGDRLASAGADRIICVWDTADGTELNAFRGHTDAVAGLAFLPQQPEFLASAGRDGQVKIWDIRTAGESRHVAVPVAARAVVSGRNLVRVERSGAVAVLN